MPTAARAVVDAMERMAEAGFNYGRATSEPIHAWGACGPDGDPSQRRECLAGNWYFVDE